MTFRYDTQHLSPQVQQIIRQRDENDRILKDSSRRSATSSARDVWPISIFMRLGYDATLAIDGPRTIRAHEEFCKQQGFVWFSTNSLVTGMSKTRRSEFLNAVRAGKTVEMCFAAAGPDGKPYELSHRAEAVDIESDAAGLFAPEEAMTPEKWKEEKRKIWIKIRDLASSAPLTTKDFVVASTECVLAQSIANSQFSFGHVKRA